MSAVAFTVIVRLKQAQPQPRPAPHKSACDRAGVCQMLGACPTHHICQAERRFAANEPMGTMQ